MTFALNSKFQKRHLPSFLLLKGYFNMGTWFKQKSNQKFLWRLTDCMGRQTLNCAYYVNIIVFWRSIVPGKVAVRSFAGVALSQEWLRDNFKYQCGRAVCQSVICFFSKFNEEMLACTCQSHSQQWEKRILSLSFDLTRFVWRQVPKF